MKKLLFILLLLPFAASSQSKLYLRGDSIYLERTGGNAELIILNGSRANTGAFLKNKVNGRTEFRYAVDSAWVSGDSLYLKRGSHDTTVFVGGAGSSTPLFPLAGSNNWATYNVDFNDSVFLNNTLVNQASTITSFFNNGLRLRNSQGGTIDNYPIKWTKYGFLVNEKWTQKILFEVLDSSDLLSIGIGIKSEGIRDSFVSTFRDQYAAISANLGDTTGSGIYNIQETFGGFYKGSVLINVGDYIELTLTQNQDSNTVTYRNLTTNDVVRVDKFIWSLSSSASTRIGYPTLYFQNGNVRLINWEISKPDQNFDYVVITNSIGWGHSVDSIKEGHWQKAQQYTGSIVNNMGKTSGCVYDFLKVREDLNFRNKTVFLDALWTVDVVAGKTTAQTLSYLDSLVRRLKDNNNRCVFIYTPYRPSFLGTGLWAQQDTMNRYVDSLYGGIYGDIVIKVDTVALHSDNIHPNNAGHQEILDSMLVQAPFFFDKYYLENLAAGYGLLFNNLIFSADTFALATRDWLYKVVDSLPTGGPGGTPGGDDMDVQINDMGSFYGEDAFSYNKTTNTLNVTGIIQATGVTDGSAVGPIIAKTTGTGILGTALTLDVTSETSGQSWSFLNTGSTSSMGTGKMTYYTPAYGYVIAWNTQGETIITANGSTLTDAGAYRFQNPDNSYFGGETQHEVQLKVKDISTPSTPSSGYGLYYVNTDRPMFLDDGGNTYDLAQNIYNTNGTLTGARTVSTGANTLTISTATAAVNPFAVTATTGNGISSTVTTGKAIYGENSGSNVVFDAVKVSASTNAVQEIMNLRATSSGTAAAGFGASLDFYGEASDNSNPLTVSLRAKSTDATAATFTSALDFFLQNQNNNAVRMSLYGDGRLELTGRLNKKQGADVASAAGAIAVGADGNCFEITGTAAITLISNLNWINGSEITLVFTSTATLTDGTANSGTDIGMELAGATNFTASADDMITLVLTEVGGVQRWREKSRSVN